MGSIHNERTKLTANAFNTAATSCFTVPVPAPLAAALYNIVPGAIPVRLIALGAAMWFSVALILHYNARRQLGALIA
jgi:hypothetical protein